MIVWIPEAADLFSSDALVLVNPVNAKGVMGKGLALEFAKRFPAIVPLYQEACKTKRLVAGGCLLIPAEKRWIACLATKDDWIYPSRLEYIWNGLRSLVDGLSGFHTQRLKVAVPALGCGLGGLDWKDVRGILMQVLEQRRDVLWEVYVPANHTEALP